jgi:hypothetical protein
MGRWLLRGMGCEGEGEGEGKGRSSWGRGKRTEWHGKRRM